MQLNFAHRWPLHERKTRLLEKACNLTMIYDPGRNHTPSPAAYRGCFSGYVRMRCINPSALKGAPDVLLDGGHGGFRRGIG